MGKNRLVELLAPEAANTAGTKTIDIDTSNPISRISIQMKGTNNGSTPTAHPAKMISKIELLDGSDVLFSLSGIQAQALNYYEKSLVNHIGLAFSNDVQAIAMFDLNFGRMLWDKELCLVPSKFQNLQLKITHNKASGGSTPDAGELSAFASVFEEADLNPKGFLMSKEQYSYSLTSSAHERISLATDYLYRKIIINSLSAGKQPWEQYNKVKLSLDQDKNVLINNISTSNLIKLFQRYPALVEAIIGTGTGSEVTHYVTPSYATYVVLGSLVTAQASVLLAQSYGGTVGINSDNAETFQALVTGICPHGAMEIPFGDQDKSEEWLNVKESKKVELDITGGSSVGSSSTCEITTQQLREY